MAAELLFPIGLAVGILIGFLAWGLHLRATRSKMAELTAQMIDLGLDRRRLEQDRNDAFRELDKLLKEKGALRGPPTHSTALVVQLDQAGGRDRELVTGVGPKTAVLLASEDVTNLTTPTDLDRKHISEIANTALGVSIREPEKLPNHPRRRAPQDLTLEIKEPDLSPLP